MAILLVEQEVVTYLPRLRCKRFQGRDASSISQLVRCMLASKRDTYMLSVSTHSTRLSLLRVGPQ